MARNAFHGNWWESSTTVNRSTGPRNDRRRSRDEPLTAAVMVFNVLYFIAAFELMLYSCMVANRDWLLSTYTRTLSDEAYFGGSGGVVDSDSDLEYDYGSFIVDYWHIFHQWVAVTLCCYYRYDRSRTWFQTALDFQSWIQKGFWFWKILVMVFIIINNQSFKIFPENFSRF